MAVIRLGLESAGGITANTVQFQGELPEVAYKHDIPAIVDDRRAMCLPDGAVRGQLPPGVRKNTTLARAVSLRPNHLSRIIDRRCLVIRCVMRYLNAFPADDPVDLNMRPVRLLPHDIATVIDRGLEMTNRISGENTSNIRINLIIFCIGIILSPDELTCVVDRRMSNPVIFAVCQLDWHMRDNAANVSNCSFMLHPNHIAMVIHGRGIIIHVQKRRRQSAANV